ncbi:uncharacterized protein LAESUDRAFT_568472 [Laetiporus sulphureus 93-53]|uniref:Histone deacetylase complex subunit SAP30 Sin3 binding domain-containing protein n=1 Tax=Laetiporus sulphureus 93-53 TaxID=1314785 RepID=A0A165FHG0_9APHY|nr:uncharacterized protein LAESUDRAFT_568472 [Laetiporus sulphureus 93-53]KZT08977.1 hypothetical protein LAESUDRAFT_568472 [Laetiporus sulphureus 93-53]
MPPSTTATPAGTSSAAGGSAASRSRPQTSRRRAHQPADDAAYHAPPSASNAGTKRAAVERAEGEPRLKRKRVDTSANAAMAAPTRNGSAGPNFGTGMNGIRNIRLGTDGEGKISLVNFTTLPLSSIYEYLIMNNLVPQIDPSPLTAYDPPTPISLLFPPRLRHRSHTASPPITPANRPRRRRSARLVEDEQNPQHSVVPILADVDEVKDVLATIAQQHWQESSVKEVDTLATFMCAVKAKARTAA